MIVFPDEETIQRAGKLIREGGVVAFPTETVYGLGANALDAAAVLRVFEIKRRPQSSPLIVHVADEAMARSLVLDWPPIAAKLAQRFWPGPLTLVLHKAAFVPDIVTAGLDSVGIRMPSHPVALQLLGAARVPIAAPSANLFTELSPTTAEHVESSLGKHLDLILDGGAAEVGIESTVVSLRRDPPALLRPGVLTIEELEAVTGVRLEPEQDQPRVVDDGHRSPGMHPIHYAPQTPFYVLDESAELPQGTGRMIDMPDDRDCYARVLYARLHEADAEGWDWIAVREPPSTAEWLGISDRLRRAGRKTKP